MINRKTYDKYAADPLAFIEALNIDVSGTVKRWGDCLDPWQRADFAALAPGMLRCAGRKEEADARMRGWFERPRGASKSSDIAAVCVWLLVFGTRPLKLLAYAADREQSAILKAAVATILRLNPWLGEILAVQQHSVVNIAQGHPAEGATLSIEASDAASSYGALPDAVVVDELTHWPEKAGAELFASVISSVAKRDNCLLFGIMNSGFTDSFVWKIRCAVQTDPNWIFSRLEGQASWMTEARLAEQRKLLPPVAFARLWLNQWSSGGGDALTSEDVDSAFVPGLQEMTGSEEGWSFVLGCDLGITRDCSAIVVLATPKGRSGKIRLAHHKIWRPTAGNKVRLLDVEKHILELDRRFGLEFAAFDPWQAEHLAATLEADSEHRRRSARRLYGNQPWARPFPPTAANLREQATLTIESFKDGRLQLFDCPDLRRDFTRLRVEERPSGGFRLTSPRDDFGHGDSASAFCLALLVAHEISVKGPSRMAQMLFSGVPTIAAADPWSAFDQRQREYQEEMQFLASGGNDNSHELLTEGLRRMAGRLNERNF